VKDKERAQLLAPYLARLKSLRDQSAKSAEVRQLVEEFRWLVEEYKVSLFAQELGTAVPVSPQRLDQLLQTSGLVAR
jgi:ATP-dependent helicase HrpA